MHEPWPDVNRAGDWLLGLARAFSPEVVHLNGFAHGALPFRVPVMVVAHSCVLSWWQAVHGGEAPARYAVYAQRVRRGLAGAEVVVAPSHAMRASLVHHYGPTTRTVVIPNGCAAPVSMGTSSHEEPFVLAAGRMWDEAKNLSLLAEAAPRIGCPIYVAGERQAPTGLAAPARLPGAEADHDGVRQGSLCMLGPLARETMAHWMGRAAIFAHPARYEPFGLSVLEAASAGCALVLGDIPSLRELWDGAAEFVPTGDADALARAIEALRRSEGARRALASRSRARAARYDLDSFLGAYRSEYARLLAPLAEVS